MITVPITLVSRDRNRVQPATDGRRYVAVRWLIVFMLVVGLLELLWLSVLATQLTLAGEPASVVTAWVELDAMEASGLLLTAWLLHQGDPRAIGTSVLTAMLLITDAWLDTLSADPGGDLITAVIMAVAIEVPLAVLCLLVAGQLWRTAQPTPACPTE